MNDQADHPAYRPVPVSEAQGIASLYAKAIVVIVAYDDVHERVHVATYGRRPEQKVMAADLGDRAYQAMTGLPATARETYEDFRLLDAARLAAQLEQLRAACRSAELALRSVLAVRDGASDSLLQGAADACQAALAVAPTGDATLQEG